MLAVAMDGTLFFPMRHHTIVHCGSTQLCTVQHITVQYNSACGAVISNGPQTKPEHLNSQRHADRYGSLWMGVRGAKNPSPFLWGGGGGRGGH